MSTHSSLLPPSPFASSLVALSSPSPSGLVAETRIRIRVSGGLHRVVRVHSQLVPQRRDDDNEHESAAAAHTTHQHASASASTAAASSSVAPAAASPAAFPYRFGVPPPQPPKRPQTTPQPAPAESPPAAALFSSVHAAAAQRIYSKVVFSDDDDEGDDDDEDDEEEPRHEAERRAASDHHDDDDDASVDRTLTHADGDDDDDDDGVDLVSSSDEGLIDEDAESAEESHGDVQMGSSSAGSSRGGAVGGGRRSHSSKLRSACKSSMNKSGIQNFNVYLSRVRGPGVQLLDLQPDELLELVPDWILSARTLTGGFFKFITFRGYLNCLQRVIRLMSPPSVWAHVHLAGHPPIRDAFNWLRERTREIEGGGAPSTATTPSRIEMTTRRAERIANGEPTDTYYNSHAGYSPASSAPSSPKRAPVTGASDDAYGHSSGRRANVQKLTDADESFLIGQLDPNQPEGLLRLNFINVERYCGVTFIEEHRTMAINTNLFVGRKLVTVRYHQDDVGPTVADDADDTAEANDTAADNHTADNGNTAMADAAIASGDKDDEGAPSAAAAAAAASVPAVPSPTTGAVDPLTPFEVCDPSDPRGVPRLVEFVMFVPPRTSRRGISFMYERPWDGILCPVALWRAYLSRRPPVISTNTPNITPAEVEASMAVWLQPKRHFSLDSEWFHSTMLGRTRVGGIITTLAAGVGLTGAYTNSSVRHRQPFIIDVTPEEIDSMREDDRRNGYGVPTKEQHRSRQATMDGGKARDNTPAAPAPVSATTHAPAMTVNPLMAPIHASGLAMPPPFHPPFPFPFPPPPFQPPFQQPAGPPAFHHPFQPPFPPPVHLPPMHPSPVFFTSDPAFLASQHRHQQFYAKLDESMKRRRPDDDDDSTSLPPLIATPGSEAVPSTLLPPSSSSPSSARHQPDVASAASLLSFLDRFQGDLRDITARAATWQRTLVEMQSRADHLRSESDATIRVAQLQAKLARQFQTIEEQRQRIDELTREKQERDQQHHHQQHDEEEASHDEGARFESEQADPPAAMEIDSHPTTNPSVPPAVDAAVDDADDKSRVMVRTDAALDERKDNGAALKLEEDVGGEKQKLQKPTAADAAAADGLPDQLELH